MPESLSKRKTKKREKYEKKKKRTGSQRWKNLRIHFRFLSMLIVFIKILTIYFFFLNGHNFTQVLSTKKKLFNLSSDRMKLWIFIKASLYIFNRINTTRTLYFLFFFKMSITFSTAFGSQTYSLETLWYYKKKLFYSLTY